MNRLEARMKRIEGGLPGHDALEWIVRIPAGEEATRRAEAMEADFSKRGRVLFPYGGQAISARPQFTPFPMDDLTDTELDTCIDELTARVGAQLDCDPALWEQPQ